MNGGPAPYCKHSYIGAPVRAYVHACEYCQCGGPKPKNGCHCGCHHKKSAVCQVVVDDANNRVYLYGDGIVHENYHIPGADCVAHVAVESAGFHATALQADEFFDGEQDNNNIRLANDPIKDNTFLVFLNGMKQREGAEYDYVVTDNVIHFNFHELLPTDRVEVMYTYGGRD